MGTILAERECSVVCMREADVFFVHGLGLGISMSAWSNGRVFVAVLHHVRLTCRVALDWRLWTNGLS